MSFKKTGKTVSLGVIKDKGKAILPPSCEPKPQQTKDNNSK